MIQISGMPSELMESLKVGDVERNIFQQMDKAHALYSYRTISEFLYELEMRKNMIESAEEMNEGQAEFTTFRYSRCNPKYWNLTQHGGFLLKSNESPSDAILDIYANSSLYAFECATACVIILHHAFLKSIGKQLFNSMFQNLYLYSWHTDPDLGLYTFYANHFIPGDVVYFNNPDYSPETPWFRGLNAVAMTEDKFFGHGFGIRTNEEMIQLLNDYRKEGSNQSAYLTNLISRPSFNQISTLPTFQTTRKDHVIPHIVIHHNRSSISYLKYLFYLNKKLLVKIF